MQQQKAQYLRIILTNRCNLNCHYCHKEGMSHKNGDELTSKEIIAYSNFFYDIGIRKFKLMGGEPTLRDDLAEIIRGLRKYAVNSDISLITNGFSIETLAPKYLEAGLNRINISIHDWIKTKKQLQDSILWLKERKALTKINFVIQKGINEKETIDLI